MRLLCITPASSANLGAVPMQNPSLKARRDMLAERWCKRINRGSKLHDCQELAEDIRVLQEELESRAAELQFNLQRCEQRAEKAEYNLRFAQRERDELREKVPAYREALRRAMCMCSHKDFRQPCGWCVRRKELLGE